MGLRFLRADPDRQLSSEWSCGILPGFTGNPTGSEGTRRMSDEIPAYPLAGWTTHALPDAAALVTLHLVPNPRALVTGERHLVKVKMTPAQARDLSDVLLRLAELTERSMPTTIGN
jgi:hypothetical protein